VPQIAIYFLWVLWIISWTIAALWTTRTERRAPFGEEFISRVFTVIGALLLFGLYAPRYVSVLTLWRVSDTTGWLLVAVTAGGFLFSWWARIHLGSLWSSTVTLKEGHHVVNTGPYRIVRHPIYTGIIVATFAMAADKGTYVAIAGALLMLVGWFIKARVEERFLRVQLGADAYDAYARRTAMLIPFVRV
jgi:protein-S-isoprenylcysteine O-methyltransferase Ste14